MKIIVLPNKKKCKYGKILRFNSNLYKISLCDFLLKNNIKIDNNCGGFGKCTSCTVFINEGFFFLNSEFLNSKSILSCQIYNINCNIVLSVF
ncbi:2Fe-2S iron-sulfur cluster-binding protein [Candidatus Nasuia deltocephalinicola]|uniref:2Fe-2S iron-sulfur cluster-binding protein n=1 Tax=Candidatus Nasuia deltocephalincola TaxID=1160784 RepID=UPI00216AFC00|nr:2Fe-2S iron-sulfur cluster-binding protein [Candidatus Nasuia deltocephalinicola]